MSSGKVENRNQTDRKSLFLCVLPAIPINVDIRIFEIMNKSLQKRQWN